MVKLDHALIDRANRLIHDGNIQRTKHLIFVYEQAVKLQNEGVPGSTTYQKQHEEELRRFVEQEFRLYNKLVMKRAQQALINAQRLQEKCLQLDERVNATLWIGHQGSSQ